MSFKERNNQSECEGSLGAEDPHPSTGGQVSSPKYPSKMSFQNVLAMPGSSCETAHATSGSQTQGAKSLTRTRPLIRP